MILVDTSVWVEELRQTQSLSHLTLQHHLERRSPIVITEPVVMELLAGARTVGEHRAIRKRLLSFPMLRVHGLDTYERAAMIWRACRLGGEPVRNHLDCLVAAVAIREGVSVLHADRDFDAIARHTELRVEPARRSRRRRREEP
jgi:predicted nucleic acid-binding protein